MYFLVLCWKMHYLSWKGFSNNNLLIKYEDLLGNPMNEITKIYNYLKKFFDLNLENEDFDKILELSSFENLFLSAPISSANSISVS